MGRLEAGFGLNSISLSLCYIVSTVTLYQGRDRESREKLVALEKKTPSQPLADIRHFTGLQSLRLFSSGV